MQPISSKDGCLRYFRGWHETLPILMAMLMQGYARLHLKKLYFEDSITEKAIYLKAASSFIQADFRIQCPLENFKKLGEDFFFSPQRY